MWNKQTDSGISAELHHKFYIALSDNIICRCFCRHLAAELENYHAGGSFSKRVAAYQKNAFLKNEILKYTEDYKIYWRGYVMDTQVVTRWPWLP